MFDFVPIDTARFSRSEQKPAAIISATNVLLLLNKPISELKIDKLFPGTSQEGTKKQKNSHKHCLYERRNVQLFHEIEISFSAE